MNWQRTGLITVVSIFTLGLWLSTASSKDKKPPRPRGDVNNLMKELLSMKLGDNSQCLAIWMPFEAFVEFSTQPDGKNRAAVEEEIDFLRKYQVIVTGGFVEDKEGTRTYATQKELEQLATLKLATGEVFPLAEKVPPRVAGMAAEFKRTFAANQGDFGKNMHVLIFSATARDGKTVLTANMRNTVLFTYKEGKGFKAARLGWRTPFDALNPVPPCRRCDEPLSGKWSYCPWCGAKIDRR
jgi:hypothetical protein